MISNYADFIILRHYEDSIDEVTKVSDIPIINAGSGKAYHPTQTLLDTYTIESYFSSLSNLNITIAAYAGNLQQSIELAQQKKLAVFTMGLMSNPEFQTEMNFANTAGIKLYEYRTKIAMDAKVDVVLCLYKNLRLLL